MADFYADISAIGNEYQAYADTPTTWGVPQDGNGKAGPGHSAAVAVATLDCTSAQGDGAQTLTVLGVSVANSSSASGATLAASLVTSINGTATAVGSTYSALLLPLNKLIFARQNPGNTAQVQIMLRIAGADWNGVVTSHAGFTTGPTITNFTGGADGPFAYQLSTSTLFGKTAGTYGTWFASSAGVTDPGANDIIHCRTSRSGSNLSVLYSLTVASQPTWKARNHLYDNGTVWSGDNGQMTVEIVAAKTDGFQNIDFFTPASGAPQLASRSQYNLLVLVSALYSTSRVELFSTASSALNAALIASKFEVKSTSLAISTINIVADFASTQRATIDLTDSKVESTGTVCTAVNMTSSNTYRLRLACNGLAVTVLAATGGVGGIGAPIKLTGATANGIDVEWVGGSVIDSAGVATCLSPVTLASDVDNANIVLDSIDGITDAYIGFSAAYDKRNRLVWNSPNGANKAMRYETAWFVADWKGDGSFPFYNAQDPQGGYWSHRITWHSAPSARLPIIPLKLSFFYRDTAAVKTFALELYVPDSTTVYTDELVLSATYVDSSGVVRQESTQVSPLIQFSTTRAAIASSASAWTSNGVASHSAKKLSITTAYSIMQNTEVSVVLALRAPRSPNVVFYVSPEVSVS